MGNITDIESDVIVNAANDQLILGGGVAGAIKLAGGFNDHRESIIQKECDEYKKNNKVDQIAPGTAVTTSAGNMRPKITYVIHAVAPDCRTNQKKQWRNHMVDTYLSIAQEARKIANKEKKDRKLSITIPSLGTGIFSCPLEESAHIACLSVILNIGRYASVHFVVYDEKTYNIYKSALLDLSREFIDR